MHRKIVKGRPFTLASQPKHGGLRRFFLFSHPRQCKSARRRRNKHPVGNARGSHLQTYCQSCDVIWCDQHGVWWHAGVTASASTIHKSFRFFAAGAIFGKLAWQRCAKQRLAANFWQPVCIVNFLHPAADATCTGFLYYSRKLRHLWAGRGFGSGGVAGAALMHGWARFNSSFAWQANACE